MKKKTLLILVLAIFTLLALASCARNSNSAIDRALKRGENAIDRGIGDIGDGIENATDMITDDMYGANSGYSGYAGTGNAMEIFPTIRDKSRDNMGQINTTNGSADGGMGDMYDDMERSRNSLRTDTFSMGNK